MQRFKIRVALRFLKKHWRTRSVLTRFRCLVIPVCAFYQPDGEPRTAPATPLDQISQVAFGVSQIRLNNNPGIRPILELRLGENGFEQFKSRILEGITLHVEIDECA
jgi:hypothetical protein